MTIVVNKKFKENLGPKPLLHTERGKLNKLKFKIILINIYGKFNVIFYTNELFRWFLIIREMHLQYRNFTITILKLWSVWGLGNVFLHCL